MALVKAKNLDLYHCTPHNVGSAVVSLPRIAEATPPMAQDQYLSEKEIDEFLNDLDKNSNGYIEYDEVEHKLDEVHKEIAPDPKPHHLHHEDREDAQRRQFLRNAIGADKNRIHREDFASIVRGWKVPFMDPDKKAEEDHKSYMRSLSWGRRLRAYWSVEGPEVLFIMLVISMQIAFGT
jgi:dual oxidase